MAVCTAYCGAKLMCRQVVELVYGPLLNLFLGYAELTKQACTPEDVNVSTTLNIYSSAFYPLLYELKHVICVAIVSLCHRNVWTSDTFVFFVPQAKVKG